MKIPKEPVEVVTIDPELDPGLICCSQDGTPCGGDVHRVFLPMGHPERGYNRTAPWDGDARCTAHRHQVQS